MTTHPDASTAELASDPLAVEAAGFTLWAIFRRSPGMRQPDSSGVEVTATAAAAELDRAAEVVTASGVTIRGWYDVSGLRADADLMIWLHGDTAEALQTALRVLRRTEMLTRLLPTWNALGVHRGAEFNRAHVPGFLRGEAPRDWLVLYPFVRDTEWYLLPDADRGRMLAEHGRLGAQFRGVVANTVASFALGDYEWLLPMESDDLTELVDLMRALRATDARRHMRAETPFFTGRRIALSQVSEVLR